MYQTKIFSGCFNNIGGNSSLADDKFNEWIQEHPEIEIVEFRYQQERYGDHSIAILYKTTKREKLTRDERIQRVRETAEKLRRKGQE